MLFGSVIIRVQQTQLELSSDPLRALYASGQLETGNRVGSISRGTCVGMGRLGRFAVSYSSHRVGDPRRVRLSKQMRL
jgi:hypothetical protein